MTVVQEILSTFALRRIVDVRIKNARGDRTSAKAVFFGTPRIIHLHLAPPSRGHLLAGETCDLEYWTDHHAYSIKAEVATMASDMGMAQLRLDERSIAHEIEKTRRRETRFECAHPAVLAVSPRDKRTAEEDGGIDLKGARFIGRLTDISENGAGIAVNHADLPPLALTDPAARERFWLDRFKGLTIALSFSYVFLKARPDQFEQETVAVEAVVRNIRLREHENPLCGADEPRDFQLGVEFEFAAGDAPARDKIECLVKSRQVLMVVKTGE